LYNQNKQNKEKRQVKTSYSQKMVKDIGTVDGRGWSGIAPSPPLSILSIKSGKIVGKWEGRRIVFQSGYRGAFPLFFQKNNHWS
jgi:hypothetical protein